MQTRVIESIETRLFKTLDQLAPPVSATAFVGNVFQSQAIRQHDGMLKDPFPALGLRIVETNSPNRTRLGGIGSTINSFSTRQ